MTDTNEPCTHCGGGGFRGDAIPCPKCRGTGVANPAESQRTSEAENVTLHSGAEKYGRAERIEAAARSAVRVWDAEHDNLTEQAIAMHTPSNALRAALDEPGAEKVQGWPQSRIREIAADLQAAADERRECDMPPLTATAARELMELAAALDEPVPEPKALACVRCGTHLEPFPSPYCEGCPSSCPECDQDGPCEPDCSESIAAKKTVVE